MLTEHQVNLIFISAQMSHKRNKREAFICAMCQLTTVKIYFPTAMIFQNKEYQDLENEFNSLKIDY
jgi:hypothetical protein